MSLLPSRSIIQGMFKFFSVWNRPHNPMQPLQEETCSHRRTDPFQLVCKRRFCYGSDSGSLFPVHSKTRIRQINDLHSYVMSSNDSHCLDTYLQENLFQRSRLTILIPPATLFRRNGPSAKGNTDSAPSRSRWNSLPSGRSCNHRRRR